MVPCSVCGREFRQREGMEQHFAAKHNMQDSQEKKPRNALKFLVAGGIVAALAFWAFLIFSSDNGSDAVIYTDVEAQQAVLGSQNATVTLVEFSDFQCPFCGRFFRETEPLIKSQYVDTGKLKFVYRHFPVDAIHPQATKAALASECANEQGKFWPYHDILFSNQNSLGERNYKKWAGQLGLDVAQFDSCYDTGKYLSKIRDDAREGRFAGVRGTPGFLLNGKLISGAQPFSVFQREIDAALAGRQ